jgi:hypothetical protein
VRPLLHAVDDAGLNQVYQAVREHLGVHAQVAVAPERGEHRVGDGADARLQGRAVLDEAGAVSADGRLGVAQAVRR